MLYYYITFLRKIIMIMISAINNPVFNFLLNNIKNYLKIESENNPDLIPDPLKYNGLTFASVLSSGLRIDLKDALALIAGTPIKHDILIPQDTTTLFDYMAANLRNIISQSNPSKMSPHELNSDLALNAFNCSSVLSVMFMKQTPDCVLALVKI